MLTICRESYTSLINKSLSHQNMINIGLARTHVVREALRTVNDRRQQQTSVLAVKIQHNFCLYATATRLNVRLCARSLTWSGQFYANNLCCKIIYTLCCSICGLGHESQESVCLCPQAWLVFCKRFVNNVWRQARLDERI